MNAFFEGLIPLFGILFSFGIPGIIVFWVIYTKHRERMRLIEKGLSPEDVKNYFAGAEKKYHGPSGSLKWGILFLFLGGGIFIANVLEQKFDFNDGITFGVVVLFVGAGFVTYYLLARGRVPASGDDTKISNN